jgi:hypothetical protein
MEPNVSGQYERKMDGGEGQTLKNEMQPTFRTDLTGFN